VFTGGGSGIGVGLAVSVAGADADAALPAGGRPARLSEVFPPEDRSDRSLGEELARIGQLESMLAAYKADLIVELGYRRPQARDVPAGGPARPCTPRWTSRAARSWWSARSSSPTSSPAS
jgi:hypothetical protein